MIISPSQMSLYETCQMKWHLSRSTPEPQSPEAGFGTVVHDMVAAEINGKFTDFKSLPSILAFMPDPELSAKIAKVLTSEALRIFQSLDFVEVYTEDMVEALLIRGRLDLYGKTKSGHVYIIDWKTTSRTFTKHDARTSDQLTCYYFLAYQRLGVYPDYVCLAPLETHTGWGYLLKTTRSQKDLNGWLKKLNATTSTMSQRMISKNPSACFNYGKRCYYYDTCWEEQKVETIDNIPRL